MASEGGGFNPANFYIGVVELFAIVLPGAILTFLLYWSPFRSVVFEGVALSSRPVPHIPGVGSIIFVVVSYLTGHFLAALGYIVMDPIFENYYASARGDRLRNLAGRAKTAVAGAVELGEGRDEQFRWATAYLNLCSPQASTRLDTLEADCKFFRNLTPLILLSFPLIDSLYSANSRVGPKIEFIFVFPIAIFVIYQAVWNRRKKPLNRVNNSVYALLVLWLPLMCVSIWLCDNRFSHAMVDLGLYGLMLVAGMRYLGLQGKLMSSSYELLIATFCKRPDAAVLGGVIPKA